MVKGLFLIGIGSFIGGISRYVTQQFVQLHYPSSVPTGTLVVNVAGCFIIGVAYALTERGNLVSPELRMLLVTGFCGGFTTFSSFAYENFSLLRENDFFYSFLYLVMSLVGGILAVYAAIVLIRLL